MIKIVKNIGQCKKLKGKSKYLLYTNDSKYGEMYAKIRLKSILFYVKSKIKGTF